MRHVALLLVGFTLFGCYRAVRNHRRERTVTTIETRETKVPTYGTRFVLASESLDFFVSRDLECRTVADVDVEYELVVEKRELNWPKIPFFVGLGVGAVTSGMALLFRSVSSRVDGDTALEDVAIGVGAGIAAVGVGFGVPHAIAPEEIEETTIQPARREERVLEKQPACSTGPVTDEAVKLVTSGGRTLELRTDAEGKISIPLDRIAHTTLLEGELGTLKLTYDGKTIDHRLELPQEMLVSIARAASKTENPIAERPLSVADGELIDHALRAIGRSDCQSAVLALEKASDGAKENARFLETLGDALACANRTANAERAYAARYRMKPDPTIERKLGGAPEREVELFLVGGAAPAKTDNPLHDAVLAVFPIHFNLKKKMPENDRSGLFQLYLASLGEQGVRMVPPTELKRRLAEQKVESFRECYDTNCQIELGKAVAASVALQTAITPIGDTCIVTSTAFDLKTETSIKTAKRKSACKTKALSDALEAVAIDLGSP